MSSRDSSLLIAERGWEKSPMEEVVSLQPKKQFIFDPNFEVVDQERLNDQSALLVD